MALLSFFAYLNTSDETRKQEVLLVSIIFGMPSLPSMIILCLTYKREALLDLLTPVFLISASVMFVTVNATSICGEQNKQMRRLQVYLCLIIYCNFA